MVFNQNELFRTNVILLEIIVRAIAIDDFVMSQLICEQEKQSWFVSQI